MLNLNGISELIICHSRRRGETRKRKRDKCCLSPILRYFDWETPREPVTVFATSRFRLSVCLFFLLFSRTCASLVASPSLAGRDVSAVSPKLMCDREPLISEFMFLHIFPFLMLIQWKLCIYTTCAANIAIVALAGILPAPPPLSPSPRSFRGSECPRGSSRPVFR